MPAVEHRSADVRRGKFIRVSISDYRCFDIAVAHQTQIDLLDRRRELVIIIRRVRQIEIERIERRQRRGIAYINRSAFQVIVLQTVGQRKIIGHGARAVVEHSRLVDDLNHLADAVFDRQHVFRVDVENHIVALLDKVFRRHL